MQEALEREEIDFIFDLYRHKQISDSQVKRRTCNESRKSGYAKLKASQRSKLFDLILHSSLQ